jgi:serine/threonine protein kinase
MKKLDRFILREIISDGAAGTVYKVDEVLPGDNKRTVALKVLPAIAAGDNVAMERFTSEVKVLSQLTVQPHVVTIYAMGISEGYPWLAMEYAAGTAEGRIADAPGDPAEVARLIDEVCRGLLAMHSLQPPLVHQDLKPANILDANGIYKITDFSLATVVAANRTHGLATVRYAAPELLSAEFGKVGPATDLYALGHIAYEMALGTRKHRQQFKAVFEGNTTKEPPPNKWMMWHASSGTKAAPVLETRREFPVGLSGIIERLMTKAPTQRYATAQQVLDDLAALRTDAARQAFAVTPQPAAPLTPPAPPPEAAPHPIPAPPPVVHDTGPIPLADPTAAATEPAIPRAAPQRPLQIDSNVRYWIRLRGRVSGPFDLPSLQRMIRQGQLSRLHQVSTDQATWKAASDIEGLYGPTVV